MARNQKLTSVIAGRGVSAIEMHGVTVTVRFDDGSVMTVRTDGTAPSGAHGGRVRAVRQRDTELDVDFDDGGTLVLRTAEAASCVMLRDKANVLEYAD